jgi:hypothetical protein
MIAGWQCSDEEKVTLCSSSSSDDWNAEVDRSTLCVQLEKAHFTPCRWTYKYRVTETGNCCDLQLNSMKFIRWVKHS